MLLKKFKENEKGSITIFVLSTMLLVAGVIFVSYFSMMNKSASQEEELKKIQEEYNVENTTMKQTYDQSKTFASGRMVEKNEEYTDEDGNVAIIPAGFMIVPENEKINDGLVIQDENGNEFVWIPVETVVANNEENGTNNKAMAVKIGNDYKGLLYEFSENGSEVISGCTTNIDNAHEPDILSTYDNDINYNNGLFTKDSLQQEYNKMIESVEKYHGFYISRYELGLEETRPVSKDASANTEITTADASNLETYTWYGLYSKCKEFAPKSSNKSVVSSMVWGSQYDAMLNWMKQQGEAVEKENDEKTNTSKRSGNNPNDIIRNVYDIYGCHGDWTLSAVSNNIRGYYGVLPANINSANPTEANVNMSTRISLYIK